LARPPHSLTEEVLKSSEIEGETLDRDQVRSLHHLDDAFDIPVGSLQPADVEPEPSRNRAMPRRTTLSR
jgi:hypothetical protein